jgi:glycosyltransferase involved in cell wall biosynthesis
METKANNKPTVSIVMPSYNHAQFLKAAIGSVLNQTQTNWELIIVNNFSTDNTKEVIAQFNDSRIRVIDFANHGVIAASRNLGVREARADIVAFLDSDDTWEKQKIEKCLEAINSGVEIVCHSEFIVKNGRYLRTMHYGPEKNFTTEFLLYRTSCLSPSAVMVKKDLYLAVGGMSEEKDLITAEDYDFWIKLTKLGTRSKFIREPLGTFFLHQFNNSSSVERHSSAVRNVILRHQERGLINKMKRNRRLAAIDYSAARAYIDSKQWRLASQRIWKSVRTFPFFNRPYVSVALLGAGFVQDKLKGSGERTRGV